MSFSLINRATIHLACLIFHSLWLISIQDYHPTEVDDQYYREESYPEQSYRENSQARTDEPKLARRWNPPSGGAEEACPPEVKLPPECVDLLDYHCYDKRRFIPCKFGTNCRVKDCVYSHEEAPKSDGDAATVFVGGLHFATTEDTLYKVFEEYGEVIEVKLMRHQHSGNSRGFGFIVFKKTEVAETVLRTRHLVIDGKDIEVKEYGEKASPKPPQADDRRQSHQEHKPEASYPRDDGRGFDRRSTMPCRYGPECRNRSQCPWNHDAPSVKREEMQSRFEPPR